MTSPTATVLLAADDPLALDEEEDLTELAFLGAGGCAAGAGASFRLRNSTIVINNRRRAKRVVVKITEEGGEKDRKVGWK